MERHDMTVKGSKFCQNCREAVMATFNLCPKCGARHFSTSPPKAPAGPLKAKNPGASNGWRGAILGCSIFAAIFVALFVHLKATRVPIVQSIAQTPNLDVRLEKQGGVLVVPVRINNAIDLNFVVDSGAADVSIPADVVLTLMRTGTISDDEFLGKRDYTLADGTVVPSTMFRIRSLKVGNRVLENVTASVAGDKGLLLLGQSFLSRFKSWHIDNKRQALILE
jgi:hypothetical protein